MCEVVEVDEIANYKFKALRGSNNEEFLFSFVDLSLMNLNDWIMLFNVLSQEKTKYASQLMHLKRMIRSYCLEISKMDVEVVVVLQINTSVMPCDQSDNLEQILNGFIQKEPEGIIYQVHQNKEVKNYMMFLQDKNYYKSKILTDILTKAEICKMNSNSDIKCVSDMLQLWMIVQIVVLDITRQVFEEIK